MSEEILKALMQLFAIIAKQDDGGSRSERNYVERFLRQQLNEDEAQSYLVLFDQFIEEKTSSRYTQKKMTAVSDSVKTLKICKNINKTLNGKQKAIVLVRLFELLKSENKFTAQRLDIIFTAGKVFRIKQFEIESMEQFVRNDKLQKDSDDNILVYGSEQNSQGLNGGLYILNMANADILFMRYAGTKNIYLNGLPVNTNQVYLFANGSSLKLPMGKPLYYSDVLSSFLQYDTTTSLQFKVEDLTYKFSNGNIGLHPVNVNEQQGKLVAIMGASGSGKTTLLNVLAGIYKPSSGRITLNGLDLTKQNDDVKRQFGYIPQDDLLIEDLSVYDNLFYSAKLSLNITTEEIDKLVINILRKLGLFEAKDLKVGNVLQKTISGGQRKRLNIALELIREPSVLFVDEPTSGLSSRDSENVIDLLRELALNGKLIFVVIHQPSSDIYKKFDKVILLDTGGYQIYYGNPIEALSYLKKLDHRVNADQVECISCGNVNPELIFNIVESKVVDEYGNESDKRKIKPKAWSKLFHQYNFPDLKSGFISAQLPPIPKIPSKLKQFANFFIRDLKAKLANKQYIIINSLIAPILALFSSIIIRYQKDPSKGVYFFNENDNIPAFLFITIIIAMFIGLIVSAEEIYKDKKILQKESLLNLSRFSYLVSKLAILFSISAFQVVFLVLIGNFILDIHSFTISFWLALFSIACLANLIGLNISNTFNSVVTIYIMIPLVIIPQMILGGAMFSFDKLNRIVGGGLGNEVPIIAEFMPTRWVYEALSVDLFLSNPIEKELFPIHKELSKASFKKSYLIPNLTEKVNTLQNSLGKESYFTDAVEHDFVTLKIGLQKELYELDYGNTNWLDTLSYERLTQENLDQLEITTKQLTKTYNRVYSRNIRRKNQMGDQLNEQYAEVGGMSFLEKNFTNEYLTNLVKKKYSDIKLLEYGNYMYQIKDPIYQMPIPVNLVDFRGHFYAPKKHFGGRYYTTFSFNLMVIWTMNLFLFIALYFSLFKAFSKISFKFLKRKKV